MMITKADRQRIIDGYLSETGAEAFRGREFLEWLEPQTGHPAWALFFGRDEAELARERREQMVRQFVSDLRIRIRYSTATDSGVATIRVAEVPAFVSPIGSRAAGGGYARVDSDEALSELRRQGAQSLRAWLDRYRGAFEVAGYDVSVLESFIAATDESAVDADDEAPARATG